MPSCLRALSYGLLLYLMLASFAAHAEDFSAKIRHAELLKSDSNLLTHAEIDYQLSPTAREALHKGVPLTWKVLIEIRQSGMLWDSVIYRQKRLYNLQFHALLNQYAVKTSDQAIEMFLTLNAALGYMSTLHNTAPLDASLLQPGQSYQLAIKAQFRRESLPVPLRPFAYLNRQWFLSSDWFIWPIQK